MGGGNLSTSSYASDDQSCLVNDSPSRFDRFSKWFSSFFEEDYEKISNRWSREELDGMDDRESTDPVEFDPQLRMKMRLKVYEEVVRSYSDSSVRTWTLDEAKTKILSYTPGSWMEGQMDAGICDYPLPKRTTLLVVGPKGSGKSSLINRISNVFEGERSALARAQVSSSTSLLGRDGTLYLQGYTIPRGCDSSFCLFDTCGLTNDLSDNEDLLRHWVTEGVCNGALANRNMDSFFRRAILWWSQGYSVQGPAVRVNFVIFVVSALSILRAVNSDHEEDKNDMEILARSFNSPYLSFRDDKPPVVITHGELLSLEERVNVRVFLGELLGVPPVTQIFDIPENNDPTTELEILEMLKYTLEHADKYMLTKTYTNRGLMSTGSALDKFFQMCHLMLVFLLFILLAWGTIGRTLHSCPTNQCKLQSSSNHRQMGPDSVSYHGYKNCEFDKTLNNDLGLQSDDLHQPSTSATIHQYPPSDPNSDQYVSEPSKHSAKPKKFKSVLDNKRPKHPYHRKEKKNPPPRHNKEILIEPAISWEARTRLWLLED